MKHIITCLLLMLGTTNLFAQSYTTKANGDNIEITKYTGSTDIEAIIVPTEIDGKKVSKISGLISIVISKNTKVERIFIPNGINITNRLTYEEPNLSSIVFGGDNNKYTNYGPFFQEHGEKFDNVITIGKSDYSTNAIIGGSSSNLCNAGYATIELTDESNRDYQIYQFGFTDEKRFKFDENRFEDLLWAIEQDLASNSSLTLDDIKLINLSNINRKITTKFATGYAYVSFADSYNPTTRLSNGAKVITTSNIADDQNFTVPTNTFTTDFHYQRTPTDGWNSVCMPFDITESDFPTGTKLYELSGSSSEGIVLNRVESVDAGMPCFVYSEAESWDITFQDKTITNDVEPKIKEDTESGWAMHGSFSKQEIGAYAYKINPEGDAISRTGSATALTYPFRSYLTTTAASGGPQRVAVALDEEASITVITDDAAPQQIKLYDLFGRPATNDGLHRLVKDNIIIK